MSTIAIQEIPNSAFPYTLNNSTDALQKQGFEALKALGFPSVKNEEWKYTNVSPIIKKSFNLQAQAQLKAEDLTNLFFNEGDASRLVFLNGVYQKELSKYAADTHLSVKPLSVALKEEPELVNKYLGKYAKVDTEAFAALNTSGISEGVFVHIAPNKVLDAPLYIYYITDSTLDNVFYQPRNLFVLEKSSALKLVETYRSVGANSSFTNAITEIVALQNAHFEYYKIQDTKGEAFQVETTEIYQLADSVVSCHTFTLSGALVRNNLHFRLDDKNCTGNMFGLYLVGGQSHVDNHTVVDHLKPNSLSNELYKGVLGGNGKGVFNGKIFVRQDAQKTEAYQSNKNVLLSNNASMNTKPQLEIWADDVRCSHGATSGQLDDSALFYLRARGIGEAQAKALLTKAFANDLLESVSIDSLKEQLEILMEQKLSEL